MSIEHSQNTGNGMRELLIFSVLGGITGCVAKSAFDVYIGPKIGLQSDVFTSLERFIIEMGPVFAGSFLATLNVTLGRPVGPTLGLLGGMAAGSLTGDAFQMSENTQQLEIPFRMGLPIVGAGLVMLDRLINRR